MPNVFSFISRVFKSGNKNLVENIGKTLDELTTSKEEKLAAQQKIQELIFQHEKDFLDIELKEAESYLKDIENARNREIEINKNTNGSWITRNATALIAVTVLLLTFALFYIAAFTKFITPERKEIFIYLLGVLSTISGNIIAYYFGSSKSSHEKSEQLNKMMDK